MKNGRQKMTMEVRKQIDQIATSMLQELVKEGKSKNTVFSPLSVFVLLSMLADASSGRTREEITGVLSDRNDFEQFLKHMAALQQQIERDGVYSSANAVIMREDIQQSLATDYEYHFCEVFGGKVFSTDNLATHLDSWVRRKTKGMISSVWDDSMEEMMLCMINACSFVDDWESPYKECAIQNDDFHNADHTVSRVKMLHSYESTYVENEMFTGFVKPYKGSAFSYLVLLPKDKMFSFEDYKGKLCFAELIQGIDNTYANVLMPEFNCTTDVELTDFMNNLGICTVFTPEADFSPLSSEWLKVGSMKQKAHIEVNRRETKAAAVTGTGFLSGGMPEEFPKEKDVFVNRPFFYAIVHNETGIPVFLGAVNHLDAPEEETDLMTNQEKEAVCRPVFERIRDSIISEDGIIEDISLWGRVIVYYRECDIDELKKIEAEVCNLE